ncbi:uncharacterized protein [Antedon mediterranea]|uniref:uncharacterized protein n=1 Tax=Antedon mediterranea TaxID=105859 RepID=UPI003AF7561F
MNGRQAYFVPLVATAGGRKSIHNIGKCSTVSPTIQQHAAANKAEIIRKNFGNKSEKKMNHNHGASFEGQVGSYLASQYSDVRSQVPMNNSRADFVVNAVSGIQIWEAKSSSQIRKEHVFQAARIASGVGKPVLAIGRDASISPTVLQHAAANGVEVVRMPFN